MGWALILAYVCFGVGALLILIGLVRVTYYGCAVRWDKKQRKKMENYYNNHFNSHNTDPWLKSNPLVTNRLEVSRVESDSLQDVDIQRFQKGEEDGGSLTESQRGGTPKAMRTERDVEHVYHTFPQQGLIYGKEMRLDSETLSRNARYEEPNTNLVLAKKHQQPDNLQEILDDANATQGRAAPPLKPEDLQLRLDRQESTMANGAPPSARSLDTREAFAALDYATAGESVVTPRSEGLPGPIDEEGEEEEPYYSQPYGHVGAVGGRESGGSTTPTTVSGVTFAKGLGASDEALPVKDEMEYNYEHAITSF